LYVDGVDTACPEVKTNGSCIKNCDLSYRRGQALFQYGSQEAGLVKYDKYTRKK